MSKTVVELSDKEIAFITSALNAYWNDAHDQLTEGGAKMTCERRPLGDIEKKILEQQKEFAMLFLETFENL